LKYNLKTAVFVESYIETQGLTHNSNLLQNKRRENLTRSGAGRRITAISKKAAELFSPVEPQKRYTSYLPPQHVNELLQAGVDISTIAICLIFLICKIYIMS
jgi:hypothetical protein